MSAYDPLEFTPLGDAELAVHVLPVLRGGWSYADAQRARDLLVRAAAIISDRNTGFSTPTSRELERELKIALGRPA